MPGQVCLLPYTGSFAGQPASFAAASALPVVCTRKAGLTDHLGDTGIYIDAKPGDQFAESAARQLADRILELLQSQPLREQTGVGLRARAERLLGWDTIADQTLEIYQGAGAGKAKGAMAS